MTSDRSKRILVVDDEDDVREYLSLALADVGFNVCTAADGFEALERVKREPPDLITLDLVMPKRSGAAFYRDLQKNPEWRRIPVLIVTGHARDEQGKSDFDELTMSGPGIYLEKPVKPTNLVAAVHKLLGLAEKETVRTELSAEELRHKLAEEMKNADPNALKKALNALKKS